MLHHETMQGDRRREGRTTTSAEITLVWHHDPGCVHRYALVDASDHGLRLRSATPILRGTTGTVLRLLPRGLAIDEPVMVAWCRPEDSGSSTLVGLRRL